VLGIDPSTNLICRVDPTSSSITFNRITINNSSFSSEGLVLKNMATNTSPYNAVPIGVDSADQIVKMYYTYNQNLNNNSDVIFGSLSTTNNISCSGNINVPNISTNFSNNTNVLCVDSSNNISKSSSSAEITFGKLTLSAFGNDALVVSSMGTDSGFGTNVVIDSAGQLLKDSSSLRYKENIQNYNKGIDNLLTLNPKTFNLINDPQKRQKAGLIAEELYDAGFNEFVILDKDDKPDSISYDKIVALLINSIKDLKKEIDNLKS